MTTKKQYLLMCVITIAIALFAGYRIKSHLNEREELTQLIRENQKKVDSIVYNVQLDKDSIETLRDSIDQLRSDYESEIERVKNLSIKEKAKLTNQILAERKKREDSNAEFVELIAIRDSNIIVDSVALNEITQLAVENRQLIGEIEIFEDIVDRQDSVIVDLEDALKLTRESLEISQEEVKRLKKREKRRNIFNSIGTIAAGILGFIIGK